MAQQVAEKKDRQRAEQRSEDMGWLRAEQKNSANRLRNFLISSITRKFHEKAYHQTRH